MECRTPWAGVSALQFCDFTRSESRRKNGTPMGREAWSRHDPGFRCRRMPPARSALPRTRGSHDRQTPASARRRAISLGLALASSAAAQTSPEKPIKMIFRLLRRSASCATQNTTLD
jgi:hypothetical protein